MIVCVEPRCRVHEQGVSGLGLSVARALRARPTDVHAILLTTRTEADLVGRHLQAEDLPFTSVPFDPVTFQGYWNGPGVPDGAWTRFIGEVVTTSAHAGWVVLAGGLPRGVALYAYQELVPLLHQQGVRVAVSLRGEVLGATMSAKPDLAVLDATDVGVGEYDQAGALLAAQRFQGGGVGTIVITGVGAGLVAALPNGGSIALPLAVTPDAVDPRASRAGLAGTMAEILIASLEGGPPPSWFDGVAA